MALGGVCSRRCKGKRMGAKVMIYPKLDGKVVTHDILHGMMATA